MSLHDCRATESIREGAEWCRICWRYKGQERCHLFRSGGYRLKVAIDGKVSKTGKRRYHKSK